MLSLITKKWIRGLDAFNLPFFIIDDNTNFGVIESFKSTLYTRHKVDLELNFGRTYSFILKISENGMNKFT